LKIKTEKTQKQLPEYYQWVIIGLCFLMVMIALGFCSSPKSGFVKPVCEYLDIERSVYSINDSIRYITTSITSLFFGFFVAKLGEKKMVVLGMLSLVCSMLCYAVAPNVWVIYIGGAFLGLGLSWTTTTMVGYIVNKWNKKNKGTIMGAVLASNGIGGFIAIEILYPIIDGGDINGIPGYKYAYVVTACILACVALLLLIFFVNKPKDPAEVGGPAKKKARGQGWIGMEFTEAQKKWYFYGALAFIFMTGFILQGVVGIAKPYMNDVGLDNAYVTKMFSIQSLTLVVFKFATGFVYDKKGLRFTTSLCTGAAMVVLVALALLDNSETGKLLAITYPALFSLALPLETIMLPIYASDLFGEKSYSKMIGIFTAASTAGYACGSPVANLCYDITGSYRVSFIISIVLMALTFILMQVVVSVSNKNKKRIIEEYEAEQIEALQ
jgi:MFS family permease